MSKSLKTRHSAAVLGDLDLIARRHLVKQCEYLALGFGGGHFSSH
jgi:hypothetical protein